MRSLKILNLAQMPLLNRTNIFMHIPIKLEYIGIINIFYIN